uniref:Uncharacterized protein n=1 Tax=Arundo donax TaxID=35708 RepID=A0A0A9BEP4_ARUDO
MGAQFNLKFSWKIKRY